MQPIETLFGEFAHDNYICYFLLLCILTIYHHLSAVRESNEHNMADLKGVTMEMEKILKIWMNRVTCNTITTYSS